jgi:hypothetical protein
MSAMGLQIAYPLLTPVLTSPYRHCTTEHSCNLIISTNFMFPLWFALLGGPFVFLDVGPSFSFLVFPLYGVIWFIYD